MASATSRGVPKRSNGVSSARAGLGLLAEQAVHLGLNDPRRHTVDGNTRGAQLLGQGPGQADDPRLGGG